MSPVWGRVWAEFELDDLKNYTLLVGELSSNCGKCKEMGLDTETASNCPSCGTEFRYLTSRHVAGGKDARFGILGRILKKRPDMQLIDYDDWKKLLSKQAAKDFLRGSD